ncbi:MAG: hypothetical protein JXA33_07905 [Anaerolineae bacterium]|nr:hypothetical protein [Anaerolineae bacterium]
MNTLYFEKISRFDRVLEPVTVSIPFAEGILSDPQALIIRDGETLLPVQSRVLATWPDSSIKWLLVHFQPNLLGNTDKTLYFEIDETRRVSESQTGLTVKKTGRGIEINTGPLSFLVPNDGFLPVQDVSLNGATLWTDVPFSGFTLRHNGRDLTTLSGPVILELEEAGPLKAVILVKGKHRTGAQVPYLDFRGRITAYAGKPYIEVEYQFIHAEEEAELSLEGLELAFRPHLGMNLQANNTKSAEAGSAKLALGQGYYRTAIQTSEDAPLEMSLSTETILYQENEHFIDSFYGDFWVDWRNAQGGMTLSIYQAHQNFPKALRVTQEGITCALYPQDAPPAPLFQGMAKTHRLQLHFHTHDTPIEECSVRSLQFQLPDRPALSRAWFREHNPWREAFFPEQIPDRLITVLNRLHDNRPKALGMFHFGDAPDAGYTNQGRGQGANVWVNNEYDRPHACALYYALTGQRRVLDSALVSARHWLDVDLCHYSPNPLYHGGLKIHTRYHVTGGVTPSHEWTEGFLDAYFLTGYTEALEAAHSVAENILRHLQRPEMRRPGATSVREGGWALRALVGMYIGTGEDKWKYEARRLADLYLDWYDAYGALLAPYTSHSMPRVTFMISLTINSFARYLLIEDNGDRAERIKKLIVETVDDMLAHCIGPDGIAYYKELPSLRRTAPTYHLLEALTHAYRITGDIGYLKIATRQFAAMSPDSGAGQRAKYADPSGAVIDGEGGGRVFADKYTSLLIYAGAATPLGLLDWYEYPY